MPPALNVGPDRLQPTKMGRVLWFVLLIGSGVTLSTCFACVTPFAALATVAALKLSPRDTISALGFTWLANQAVGFLVLGYPRTWDCVAWGVSVALSTGLAVLAARSLSTSRPAPLAVSLPFVAAFATFELSLYVAGFALPGSNGAFTAAIIWQVFLINAVALCGLIALYHLIILIRDHAHDRAPALRTASAITYR